MVELFFLLQELPSPPPPLMSASLQDRVCMRIIRQFGTTPVRTGASCRLPGAYGLLVLRGGGGGGGGGGGIYEIENGG